ncbi:metallophosphoesterase family protein [Candidatus Parabeggiatoa sp. HSG14]|uniref:metallophosphoesterase family protein n=1 Tax=Candidatus Parabeggiatoa sp. HSG14 TaxID=3055593 RepID=UPI0025A732D2|nr:metallophosphoesterase family protein [Thiotrichales bacterium HSG14]
MKICILSDSHDNALLLCAAVADAKQRGAQAVLHCGDIVASNVLQKLQPYGLFIHAIHGNNTGDIHKLSKLSQTSNSLIRYYGQDAGFTLGKREIFLVHYQHYAQGMALTGDYDLVCCGHTHYALIENLTNIKGTQTVLCNPGTVGDPGAPATYVLGDLETMTFDILPVS